MGILQNRDSAYDIKDILNSKLPENRQIQFIGTSGFELTVMMGTFQMFNTNGRGDLWSNVVVFLNGVNYGMDIR